MSWFSQSSVWAWVRNDRVPSKRLSQIIAAAARLDPPVRLRPDNFVDLPTPVPSMDAGEGLGRERAQVIPIPAAWRSGR